MLAFHYNKQLDAPPGTNKVLGSASQTNMRMKKTFVFSVVFGLLMVLFSTNIHAQSITLTPSTNEICLGDELVIDASVTGGTATGISFDMDNDGVFEGTVPGSGPYNFRYTYTTPGPKTIRAVTTGVTASQTANVIVYRLPIAAATVSGSPIQCFRGNLVTVVNQSQKTDNDIVDFLGLWGDGRIATATNPTPGLTFSHSYNTNGTYNITIKVTDNKGCFNETTYSGLITIKSNITPSFDVFGTRNCDTSQYMFKNRTLPLVPFSQVKAYTWDFGDGNSVTRQKPWILPKDELNYDTIYHKYTKNGRFFPALIIEDVTGCIDSFRMSPTTTGNKPENIKIEFDTIHVLSARDTPIIRRDSVCWGNEGQRTYFFKQTPNELINPGNGELLWFFDDPNSMQLNFNNALWELPHTFVTRLGLYNVRLRLSPAPCNKTLIMPVEVLGPRARIEDPPNGITIAANQKNQCQPLPSGYYRNVEFVNTGQRYKSDRVFTRWNFDDPVAPQCTSYLVPNPGFPPLGGWSTAADQFSNSTGYWRQGNKVFEGKRLDCNYSADTLPMHRYTSWDVIYRWYRYGHDFMPWDLNRYTRNPADTLLPPNAGGRIWVQPWDTLYWGKPVYLKPDDGTWSLVQGSGPAPYGLWPRIDTVESVDENGQPAPQDLEPWNRITLNNGAPDPFAGFWGNTLNGQGGYGFIPRGTLIDPVRDTFRLKYTSQDGRFFEHHYDSLIPNQPDPTTFYRYMFNRGIQRCFTVEQFVKDTQNNVGKKTNLVVGDFTKLDSLDCEHDDQIQLKMMEPDARGLGKRGVECPGLRASPDQAGIQFMLGSVSGRLGDYPGVAPDCGQSFIRFNHDSMADRLDQTPCQLDGFVDFSGAAPNPGAISTTPGGLSRPPFANNPDYGQWFMGPPNVWGDGSGTSFWYHYGPGPAGNGIPLVPPANPTGWVTVGLIIGSGDPTNPCVSDTVWYHNFLYFGDLDARFFIDPVYDNINWTVSNGPCKLYCKTDRVNFVYLDSTQQNLKHSTIAWGDHSVYVDSFYYGKPGQNDGYFIDGFRRVRYKLYYGKCGELTDPIIYDSIVFPNGLPGIDLDTIWRDNYSARIFNSSTNIFGSLFNLGRQGDSTRWQECGRTFWVKDADTLKTFYLRDIQDLSKMLLPVQHTYWSSSYEDGCKRPGTTPTAVFHSLGSTYECRKIAIDNKLLVRGVIDSAMVRNEKGQFDSIFCKDEPVHFYDSIRYFRPDCSLSDPVNGNPNLAWNATPSIPLDPPFDSYHYDTADYWRNGSRNINDFNPDGSYVEKVKWYFGDGDSSSITRPIHKYKNPGRYNVTLLSRDRNGCWDTTYCVVIVTDPVSIPTIKPGIYNCGEIVTFYNSSFMRDITGAVPGAPYDSLKTNYWFFGERKTDTLRFDASAIDTALWLYRGNGEFRIKLVIESHQGCKDTGFANLYISGPRPFIKVISDTVGCAPFKVRVVNLADRFGGRNAADTPTRSTIISWGDANNQQTASLNSPDTLEFTYNDEGTFFIFARSDDNNPQSNNNGCKILFFPDTTDGINQAIKIQVKKSYPVVAAIDRQVACVDQLFTVFNRSDTVSYTGFRYTIIDTTTGRIVQVEDKPVTDTAVQFTISDTGYFYIRLTPTGIKPNLPNCPLEDTVAIRIVRPFASFVIDSAPNSPKFVFRNTSQSASDYTWTAAWLKDPNTVVRSKDAVGGSNIDWEFDFQTDTGDVIICLEAYTADPAKPTCVDKVCDTIEYRFVVEMKIFNVFTPNGDGTNPVFDIEIKGEKSYDLVIYNRWGNKVFESKNPLLDWDGTNMNDGSECPTGTYFYVFKYELLNGESKTLNGTVTLLREDK
ncbi:MAG: PKD domain-containing protein [Bacteroidia bacterium]|jgi:gliding motility-associated-like protein|nr:PKD domain-containing protein [Bacteroidia bacterium]